MNLNRGGKLLENRDPEQPMYNLWDSIDSIIFCPLMQSLLPRFISTSIC